MNNMHLCCMLHVHRINSLDCVPLYTGVVVDGVTCSA